MKRISPRKVEKLAMELRNVFVKFNHIGDKRISHCTWNELGRSWMKTRWRAVARHVLRNL